MHTKQKFKINEIISIISKKNFFILLLSILFSILLTSIEILSLSMIVPLMDLILNQEVNNTIIENFLNKSGLKNYYTIESVLLIFVGIYFVKTIFFIFINYFNNTCFLKIAFFIKDKLLNQYLNMEYSKYSNKNKSELLVNVNQTASMFAYSFIGSIISIFSELLLFLVITTLLLFHDFDMTFFIIVILIIFSSIYFIFTKKKIRTMGIEAVKFNQLTTRYLNEIFKGYKFIKINTKIKTYINKINTIILNNLKIERNLAIISTLPRVTLEFITIFIFAVLVIFFKNQDNLQFVSKMSLYVVAAMRIIPSISKILQSMQNYKFGRESFSVLKKDLITDKKYENESKVEFLNITKFNNDIKLENVSYSYNNSEKLVLKKFNFDIKKNEKIILLGQSGSGKSTLIDIILGFLKPNEGTIKLDNQNITKKNYNLNKIIGYVPQQTFLFDDSIENNISLEFNSSKIDYSKLNNAIEKAELTGFVRSKENSYKTRIGDDGEMISGGQKQRISIARALYKDPEILIFDEATNSLDEKTELDIINFILSLKNKTIIFITHNRNLVKYFDRVFEIDN
jgi:ATP-binding cassette, subfamily B, bacterial PglK